MNSSKVIAGSLIFLFLCIFLVFGFCHLGNCETHSSEDFLRIHIRANSNSKQDQDIKYEIKDCVVKVLAPLLSLVNSKEDAERVMRENLSLIEETANGVLASKGFSYTSNAEIKKEFFPTRTYESLTLQSDFYDAVILNLGTGSGDNWWCVIYPPMCFVNDGEENIIYKSKLVELVKRFFS